MDKVAAPFTLNEYSYCWNNPEKYVDLNGKTAVEILEWGGGIAGVAIYEHANTKVKVKIKEEEVGMQLILRQGK